jgi:hypothetical protein
MATSQKKVPAVQPELLKYAKPNLDLSSSPYMILDVLNKKYFWKLAMSFKPFQSVVHKLKEIFRPAAYSFTVSCYFTPSISTV